MPFLTQPCKDLPGCGVMIGDNIALVQVGTDWVKGSLLRVEVVPGHVETLKQRYGAPTLSAELKHELGVGKAEEIGEERGREEAVGSEDARILQVDYDAQEERHKEWKVAWQESASYSFPDWPHEGPLATLHMMKMMMRAGGSPRAWLQSWARYKQIPEQDRIMHELRTLVDAVEYGGSYDQLNLPSLAAFECITRRIAAIIGCLWSWGPEPRLGRGPNLHRVQGPQGHCHATIEAVGIQEGA